MKILFCLSIALIVISCVNSEINSERLSREQKQEFFIKEYYQYQLDSSNTGY